MAKHLSPLRYPGGKFKVYNKVRNLVETNSLNDKTYIEPFAGGFGLGLGLLCDDIVQTVVLNDFDSHIYNFWFAVLNHTDDFLQMIMDTPITIEERGKQKTIYSDSSSDRVRDGFATFFLNRVNFSGVIKGGPIGGFSQQGTYKLDCRFNKVEMVKKVKFVASLKERIELYNCDASELITEHLHGRIQTSFFNIDPPYVKKGSQLYTNFFNEADHRNLEKTITRCLSDTHWIMTYDDCDLIRNIYENYHIVEYSIMHNAGGSVKGKEIVITNMSESTFAW